MIESEVHFKYENNQTEQERAMRTIRVKQQNQATIVDALINAGFEAKHSKITPLSE